jgi:hypothetical protein
VSFENHEMDDQALVEVDLVVEEEVVDDQVLVEEVLVDEDDEVNDKILQIIKIKI